MKSYLITYDLIKPENSPDYVRLIQRIKSLGLWAHPQLSVWLVKTNFKSDQIMNILTPVVDSNDKIIIIGVDNEWTTYNISTEVTNWMKQGL